MDKEFRHLPGVDKLTSNERLRQLGEELSHTSFMELIRNHLEQTRLDIAAGSPCPSLDDIVEAIVARGCAMTKPGLRPVVNATGIILHTNLGRAPLSEETAAAMNTVASTYSNLEFDLDSGRRGSRNSHIEQSLCRLTGAEAALVVNNNTSAVLLALSALTRRKEVLVSRGQAVQIGGGFRIPDVMRQSGARLVEVGTTNCTYAVDYEQAINPRTAALMRIHLSNFRMMGFTHSVTLEELVALGKDHNLPVLDDLGSGCLLDTTQFGLDPEPTVQQSIAAGVDLVFFSADKLLGGPQAGIVTGRKELIEKLKKHPLARAVRIDKIGLAGLAATLVHYLKGEAITKIPVWRMIAAPLDGIEQRAVTWAGPLKRLAGVIAGETMVGGGSLPGATLPTRLVAIGEEGGKSKRNMAQVLSQRLRQREIPVIGRISENLLLLDPRSVLPGEDRIVLKALQDAAASLKDR
ncbi:MAG: L-seryl-tRNA(Sec) selenium transferase [Dehalococcoidales bacterium]|nr:L-seryl-tRNA(Sec) selenium transferase [Dehalococcoidales bacterium]